jgi:hypothetical protein
VNIESRLQKLENGIEAKVMPVEQSVGYQILKERGTPDELTAFVKNYSQSNLSIADQIRRAYEH